MIELSRTQEDQPESKNGRLPSRRRHFIKATILSNYASAFEHGDANGEQSHAAMTFHSLATQAILELAYFPINHNRVGSLKRPLSRWLTTRLSHNYRQARKNGYIREEGYHISLKVILDERGLPREARLRANLEAVREVLSELKERRILSEMLPFREKLVQAPSRGRPKIVDVVWTLYPSSAFVDDIVNGNRKMISVRTNAGRNQGESQLLAGFSDVSSWGK